ncbi:MAG TPA: hypothetical protein VFK52_06200 [Nocardioidaceae bacterium]|nr:hypothetical protein [Nocardioidaceae bacterium]
MTDSLPEVDRFVWTGRFPDAWPHGADGWNTPRATFLQRLAAADEVVVLDAPSFPWQDLGGGLPDVPLVVRLPEDLDGEQIRLLLGDVLLSRVTEHDVLIEERADVRKALTEGFDLPDVWAEYDEQLILADRAEARFAKPRHHQLVQAVTDELATCLVGVDAPLVAVGGETEVRPAVAALARPGSTARRLEHFGVAELPDPDAVVLVLRDGGQSSDERVALIRAAHNVLHPGGHLLVLGHVVTETDGAPNPWIGELFDDLNEGTGTSLHLEELRSIRWSGDAMNRGVLLRFTSLRLREI